MRIFRDGKRIIVTKDDVHAILHRPPGVELGGEEMMPKVACIVEVTPRKGSILWPKGDPLFRYGLWHSRPAYPRSPFVLGPEKKAKRYRCKDTADFAQ